MWSNVKFYYKFFYEYLNSKTRDAILSVMNLVPYYHNEKLHINYIHRGDTYQIVIPEKKTVCKVCPFKKVETQITSSMSIDVTRDIKKKIGPHFDFHNIPTTPGLLGYDNLIFYKRNGDKIKYSGMSEINLY